MKLVDLQLDQNLIIQFLFGEQVIEFYSHVIERGESSVYVTPYFHNGSELEINITEDSGVICNIFTDDPSNKKRISWRNLELATLKRNDKICYCLKTYGFNNVSTIDDRRLHERTIIDVSGKVYDGYHAVGDRVIIHDISDVGISFYANSSFAPQSQQLLVEFADAINNKSFNVRITCAIARTSEDNGHIRIGCRITGDNKEYRIYRFMKYLTSKNKNAKADDENIVSSVDAVDNEAVAKEGINAEPASEEGKEVGT